MSDIDYDELAAAGDDARKRKREDAMTSTSTPMQQDFGALLNRFQRRAIELLDNWNAPSARTLIEEIAANRSMPSESSESDSAMLVRLIELIRAMDLQATKITRVEGDEEVVEGYRFNTGCWHRILGSIAGHDCAKWLQTPEGQARVREASERAKQTIEELRGDRPPWDEIKDKRFTV